ncbi:hypothetical protein HYE68_008656 [Fusarium pseudograminearum]|uniref:Uncharacterized protein n=1 Tax=Fusarium pseudograminearum (strain CS3096) TaxID=1028729 RepID=K3VY52_FUSPC|nr:hypothetical protein FPSE_09782 [Fusarium pseudograminearum CS3096]EKJ70045.1 hypothetical protein FPSE_09782 [Fusarium pseudograminearum CS3096]QPC77904.1 hypothetical protein HYE68_008656 [Fusarium pseudograminearum]
MDGMLPSRADSAQPSPSHPGGTITALRETIEQMSIRIQNKTATLAKPDFTTY